MSRKGLYVHLNMLKSQYLDHCGPGGGDALGHREFVHKALAERPDVIEGHINELIDAAAKTSWQKRPRETGPDLFSIAGIVCPETVTRPDPETQGPVDGAEHGAGYKKVAQQHATVDDLGEDAKLKARKAAEVGAAATRRYEMFDAARRRANGNGAAFLKDISDKKKSS